MLRLLCYNGLSAFLIVLGGGFCGSGPLDLDSVATYNRSKKGDDMGKRRSFSPEFKVEVVLELLNGSKTNAQICRDHQLAPAVVSAWKEQFLDRAPEIFSYLENSRVMR